MCCEGGGYNRKSPSPQLSQLCGKGGTSPLPATYSVLWKELDVTIFWKRINFRRRSRNAWWERKITDTNGRFWKVAKSVSARLTDCLNLWNDHHLSFIILWLGWWGNFQTKSSILRQELLLVRQFIRGIFYPIVYPCTPTVCTVYDKDWPPCLYCQDCEAGLCPLSPSSPGPLGCRLPENYVADATPSSTCQFHSF